MHASLSPFISTHNPRVGRLTRERGVCVVGRRHQLAVHSALSRLPVVENDLVFGEAARPVVLGGSPRSLSAFRWYPTICSGCSGSG